jgi:hypothetical protein
MISLIAFRIIAFNHHTSIVIYFVFFGVFAFAGKDSLVRFFVSPVS